MDGECCAVTAGDSLGLVNADAVASEFSGSLASLHNYAVMIITTVQLGL